MRSDQGAQALFELFVNNVKEIEGIDQVPEETLKEMSTTFDNVERDEREETFVMFMNLLEEAEYSYDMHQFMDYDNHVPNLQYAIQFNTPVRYDA